MRTFCIGYFASVGELVKTTRLLIAFPVGNESSNLSPLMREYGEKVERGRFKICYKGNVSGSNPDARIGVDTQVVEGTAPRTQCEGLTSQVQILLHPYGDCQSGQMGRIQDPLLQGFRRFKSCITDYKKRKVKNFYCSSRSSALSSFFSAGFESFG